MALLATCPAPDTADWYYASGTTEASGVITMPVNSGYTGGCNSNNAFQVQNNWMSMLLTMAVGNGSKEAYFLLEYSSNTYIGFYWTGTQLYPFYDVAGTTTTGSAVNVSSPVYLKISESRAWFTLSYSTDDKEWTPAMTVADPFTAAQMQAMFPDCYAGYYGTESASNVTYSNFQAGVNPTGSFRGMPQAVLRASVR